MATPPKTLPADFFNSPQQAEPPPATLPADFFTGESTEKNQPESAMSRFFSSMGRAANPVPAIKDWWEKLNNQGKSVNALGKIMELREKGLKDNDPEMKAALDEAMGVKLPTSGNPAVTQVPFMSEPAIAAGRQAAGGDIAGAAGTMTGAYGVPAAVAGTIPFVKPGAGGAARAVGRIIDNPAAQDIAGVVSPRAAHALALARRTKKAVQAFSAPDAVPVPTSATVPVLWDEIAVSQAGRKFTSLSPEQQAGVRNIATRMGDSPAEATPPPTPGRFSAEEFRSPAPPPSEVSVSVPESPQVSAAPPKRPGGVKQVGLDARKLTDKLVDWKMSPDEAAGMPKAGWVKLAFEAGVPAPTAAVQGATVFNLKKTLAGPPRTALELLDQIRKGGRVTAQANQ